MAKVIQYKPDTRRKLGFKRVSKTNSEEEGGQLNLFAKKKEEPRTIQVLRHLDPFDQALQLDDKNEELAEKLYNEAITAGVSVADAYCNLGILHAKSGLTTKAITCFTKLLVLDPRHLEGHYNLANMYYDAGNYHLAATHYEVALEMDLAFPEIAYNLALVYICLDEKEKAICNLKSYLGATDDPDQKEARSMLLLLETKVSKG